MNVWDVDGKPATQALSRSFMPEDRCLWKIALHPGDYSRVYAENFGSAEVSPSLLGYPIRPVSDVRPGWLRMSTADGTPLEIRIEVPIYGETP